MFCTFVVPFALIDIDLIDGAGVVVNIVITMII